MPKISDEHRAKRQAQILDAAWRCFYREGVQATTMEQIIAASGLSASAMYRYFKGKDDIVVAAMSHSLGGLTGLLQPLLDDPSATRVADLVGAIAAAIEAFAARPGYRLTTIALHGWSEAQRNPRLRRIVREFYTAFRDRLAARAQRWQAEGEVAVDADPQAVAQWMLSTILGFVAQSALLGDATPAAHRQALAAVAAARPLRSGYAGVRRDAVR